ncbi:MbnP family protein [Spirosoma soli]|uniref:MbnP family protein n=1 Tax=Spirosoma soli TaxID=1770529 RepID=A0ABW5M190_9BACT
MKNNVFYILLTLMVMGLAIWACDTTDTEFSGPTPSGRMNILFDNVVGSSDLALGTGTYQNAAGESFNVTKFNYFISNIRLRKEDGSEYVVPQDSSYFLVEESRPASQTLTLRNIPTGNYTGMTFLIGVDSLRSSADMSLRTGVLDPGLTTHDPMYWEWNSGYIFVKLEGTSSAAPATQNNEFMYHVGGFGVIKKINNLRSATVTFSGDLAKVERATVPTIRLKTDVLKLFNGPTQVSIAQHSSVMFEPYSSNIADNYRQMISYDRIQAN